MVANMAMPEDGDDKVVRLVQKQREPYGDWRDSLIRDKNERPKNLLHNVVTIMRNHDDLVNMLAWNELSRAIYLMRRPPWIVEPGWTVRQIADHDGTELAAWFDRHGMRLSRENRHDAIELVANDWVWNPVTDYLDRLEWDGFPRLRGREPIEGGEAHERIPPFTKEYLGSPDNFVYATCWVKWMISAVARAYNPGAKADSMIILEGPQGYMKSTMLRVLAGDEFFIDHLRNLEDKDALADMRGKWIIEIAELASFTKKENEAIKSFLSRQVDTYRAHYGRYSTDYSRRCVLAGTTNPDGAGYLRDSTGNRRFWPIPVGKLIDIARIEGERDQLWAEAVAYWRAGETWWLDPVESDHAAGLATEREEVDPLRTRVRAFMGGWNSTPGPATEDIVRGMDIGAALETPATAKRVAAILRRLGYTLKQRRVPGDAESRRYGWEK